MAKSSSWANHVYSDGYANLSNGIFTVNVNNLANKILAGEFGVLFNDITNYIHNIKYFPINRELFSKLMDNTYYLRIRDSLFSNTIVYKDFKDINAEVYSELHPIYRGLYMGKYDFNQNIKNDFTDFEPYTQVLIYLPFFGYAELSIKDIYKKYLYFRLCIDFRSGQGTYYIYSSSYDYEMELGDHTFYVNNLNSISDIKLIGTYICTIGYDIPLSTTGSADRNRDIIMSVSRFALTAGITAATGSLPLAYSTSSVVTSPKTNKYREINPTTNRLRTTHESRESGSAQTTESYSYANPTRTVLNESASMASNILASFASSGTTSQGGSAINYLYDTFDIHIIIKRSKVLTVSSSYNHIFGKPLGEVKNCSEIRGFTKFTDFHISTPNDTTASSPKTNVGLLLTEEIEMINDLMTSGVYL